MKFDVGAHGKTSAAVVRAKDPNGATLIFAHGAGAPRTHPFILELTKKIAARGVDVFAFNFLYAEAGKKLPDKTELLETTWRAAIAKVRAMSGLASAPLFIGGKSMGGRMATRIANRDSDLSVKGVICVGYPLHPPGKPDSKRAEILDVELPLLAIQGTRDELGTSAQLKRFTKSKSNIRVHAIEGGDHSLAVPKAAKRDSLAEAADAIASFIHEVIA